MIKDEQPLALLERALDQTARVIDGIRPDQRELPTPCADWDVQAVVQHVVGQDLRNFTAVAAGEMPDWRAPADELPDDWAAAFDSGARLVLATWRTADLASLVVGPGGEVPLGTRTNQQIAELAVHGWDVVRSTSQQINLDPEIADHALAWSQRTMRPESRGPGKAFGPEVPVPDDAPSYDRLAGWFGRDPAWTPSSASTKFST